jgi:hypothetical protein
LRIGENQMRAPRKALTFDDVLLVPAHSLVVPNDVSSKADSPQASRSTFHCCPRPWIR